MEMQNQSYHRPPFYKRKYLIKRGLQLRYTLLIVGMMFIISIVVGRGVLYGVETSIRREFDLAQIVSTLRVTQKVAETELLTKAQQENWTGERIKQEQEELQAQLISQQRRDWLENTFQQTREDLIPVVSALLVVVLLGGIYLSHKVAGPLYRFEKILRDIVTGDLSKPVRLRKHDELQEMAAEFSEVIESLRVFVFHQKELIKQARELAKRMEQDPAPGKEEVERLEGILSDLEQMVSKYRTEPGEAR